MSRSSSQVSRDFSVTPWTPSLPKRLSVCLSVCCLTKPNYAAETVSSVRNSCFQSKSQEKSAGVHQHILLRPVCDLSFLMFLEQSVSESSGLLYFCGPTMYPFCIILGARSSRFESSRSSPFLRQFSFTLFFPQPPVVCSEAVSLLVRVCFVF